MASTFPLSDTPHAFNIKRLSNTGLPDVPTYSADKTSAANRELRPLKSPKRSQCSSSKLIEDCLGLSPLPPLSFATNEFGHPLSAPRNGRGDKEEGVASSVVTMHGVGVAVDRGGAGRGKLRVRFVEPGEKVRQNLILLAA